MPTINYIKPDGECVPVDVPLGSSIMQGAVDNMIEGILAECGGACSCATCEVHVDATWLDRVGVAEDLELHMLEASAAMRPNRRLSCQIEVTDDLDGLVVSIPANQ
jgi:2Fe-2S ferredoxin